MAGRVRSLGVAQPGRVAFYEWDDAPPQDGQFHVETLYSGLSAGTELTFVKGTNPYLHASWDAELGVFCEGEPALRYPLRQFGYMQVGRVTHSRTEAATPGELVAMAYGHKTAHTADPRTDRVVAMPPDLDPMLGIYLAQMGPICANGLLYAAADLLGPSAVGLGDGVRGRQVLIIGAGVVGLLTGLFAKLHGAAAVAVLDVTGPRLNAAEALGLQPLDDRDGQAWRRLKTRWRHGPQDRGADVVFQCRGQATALATALRTVRPQGTVIDLAFYQGGAPEVRLGEEFHHNGLSLRCAQIARVPRGLAHLWDRQRLATETIPLLRAYGQLIREHVITDVIPLDDAPQLIDDLVQRRRHAIQVVLEMPR
jgi:NADPH:quinone reductase-like Zn-dependent oxidoreductase